MSKSVASDRENGPRSSVIDLLRQSDLGRMMPVVFGILIVGGFAAFRTDTFLTVGNMQNLLEQVSVLGVLTIGTTILMIAGKIDLSIGSAVALIAIVGAKALTEAGVSQIVVLALMVAMGTLLGLGIGLIVVTTGVQSFIVTLGLLSVFSALAFILSGSRPIPTGDAFEPIAMDDLIGIPYSAVILIVLSIVAALMLHFTAFGRRIFAMGSNNEAAFLAGVPIARVTILVFVINGALVGCAAVILVARVGSGDPNGGTGLEIKAITAAVLGGATLIGGRGSILGSFLSVILLGIIANALQIAGVPSNWSIFVYGTILILAVTWTSLRERRLARPTPIQDQRATQEIRQDG